MASLTKDQIAIRDRIKANIEREIQMCDDYADLVFLASVLYDTSKHIVSVFAENVDTPKEA